MKATFGGQEISALADVEVELPSPLADCFLHCEVECVRECCGIDAISTDPGLIAGWARQAGPDAIGLAIAQLRHLSEVFEDRSHRVSCLFLNYTTATDEASEQLLAFLRAFRSGLQVAYSGGAVPKTAD